jgi:hypothetical protein
MESEENGGSNTNAYTITKKYKGDNKGNFKRHQPHFDLFVGDM